MQIIINKYSLNKLIFKGLIIFPKIMLIFLEQFNIFLLILRSKLIVLI
mgnify:CR=1 FL=1